MSKIKITDYKTNRINKLTGGKISTYEIENYPKRNEDDGKLHNYFMTLDNKGIDGYDRGWWYVKHNMIVCPDYPMGVSIILKKSPSKYKNFDFNNINDKIESYYGYSHRGGQSFKIGDKLFDYNYNPQKEDYTEDEWNGFISKQKESIKRGIDDGWFKNEEEGYKETPISDVIPFKMRGVKIIENWDDAKQSAINMSNYLS